MSHSVTAYSSQNTLTHLAALREHVVSGADEVSGVETGLELGRDELAFRRQAMSVEDVRHRVVLKRRKVMSDICTCTLLEQEAWFCGLYDAFIEG